MKNKIVLLYILMLSCCVSAMAQENKSQIIGAKVKAKSVLIGGDLSVSYRSVSFSQPNLVPDIQAEKLTGNLFQLTSNIKTGYFVMNDFMVGAKLVFDHQNFDMDSSSVDNRETYLLFGPLLRYYLNNGIFGEASIAGGLHNFARGDKLDVVEGSFGVGYAYFVNEKISIEPMLSFRYFKKNLSGPQGSFDNRDYGPFFSIGVQAYLFRDKLVQMK